MSTQSGYLKSYQPCCTSSPPDPDISGGTIRREGSLDSWLRGPGPGMLCRIAHLALAATRLRAGCRDGRSRCLSFWTAKAGHWPPGLHWGLTFLQLRSIMIKDQIKRYKTQRAGHIPLAYTLSRQSNICSWVFRLLSHSSPHFRQALRYVDEDTSVVVVTFRHGELMMKLRWSLIEEQSCQAESSQNQALSSRLSGNMGNARQQLHDVCVNPCRSREGQPKPSTMRAFVFSRAKLSFSCVHFQIRTTVGWHNRRNACMHMRACVQHRCTCHANAMVVYVWRRPANLFQN